MSTTASLIFKPETSHFQPVKYNVQHFNDCYKDLPNLNLVNIADSAKRLSKEDLIGVKSLGVWISYRGELISVGCIGEKIVFVSYTTFDDLLASRRIFDIISDGVFFRYIENVSEGLDNCKISANDIDCMAYVSLTGFENGDYQLKGSLNFDLSEVQLNGKSFGNIVYNLIDEIDHAHKINADVMCSTQQCA